MASPPPSPSLPLAGVIAALGVTQIVGFGTTFYILALLARPIGASLDLPQGAVLGGLSLWLVVSAALGPWLGRWQDKAGSRRVMVVGSLLQSAGLALLAMAQGPLAYFAGWAILGLAAPLALYSAAFTALTQIDAPRARRSISTLTFYAGFASTAFWPLTNALMGYTDWRGILWLYGALNLLVALPIHAAVLGDAHGSARVSADDAEIVPPGLPYGAQNIAFVLFAAMLTVQALVFYTVTTQIFPMLGAFGYAGATAVFVASLIGPAQVAARIADLLAAARISALQTGVISALLLPPAFAAVLGLPAGLWSGVAFALFYGASNGLLTIARGGITLSIFGSLGYGERINRVMVPQNIIGALSPILGGALVERAGPGVLAPLLLVCALLCAALMLMLKVHCGRHGLR